MNDIEKMSRIATKFFKFPGNFLKIDEILEGRTILGQKSLIL